jgi:hypothetical protein
VLQENRAKVGKPYSQIKEVVSKDKLGINCMDEESASDEENGVCIAEWVDTAKERLLACSFLWPTLGKKDELKYTFDVTKCDKLFDVLLRNKIIRLSEGHVVPSLGQVKGTYCKWHGPFSHSTNECNYFCWQVQSALNDDRLTLGDGNKMKLDMDLFLMNVNMINFEEKTVLVCMSQANMTKGNNVIMSDEPRARMMKPKNLELDVWKVNEMKWSRPRIKPMSSMLLEKYTRQQQSVFGWLGGVNMKRSPDPDQSRAGLSQSRQEFCDVVAANGEGALGGGEGVG